MAMEGVRGHSLFVSVVVVASWLGACSGSDEEDTAGDGDSGRERIECVAAEGVSDAVCVNDTDCPQVESGALLDTARECLINNCLMNDDQSGCTAACLEDQLSTSSGCSDCYGVSAACASENCLAECIGGDSPECTACQDEFCRDDFFSCSGIAR